MSAIIWIREGYGSPCWFWDIEDAGVIKSIHLNTESDVCSLLLSNGREYRLDLSAKKVLRMGVDIVPAIERLINQLNRKGIILTAVAGSRRGQ